MFKMFSRLSFALALFLAFSVATAEEASAPWQNFDTALSTEAHLEELVEDGKLLRLGGPLVPPTEPADPGETFDFSTYGLKSAFNDDEIIELGYMPNEVVIEFDNSIDLTSDTDLLTIENTLVAVKNIRTKRGVYGIDSLSIPYQYPCESIT